MSDPYTPAGANPTLLTYALGVAPQPVQASDPMIFTLTVSNATDNIITCTEIQLLLPVGTDTTDLIEAGVTVDVGPQAEWQVGAAGGIVTLTAPAGGAVIEGDQLVFTIATTVNATPGTAIVTLAETAASGSAQSQTGEACWTVDKFPDDFSLSSLDTEPPGHYDIAYGATAELMWTATGAGVTCMLDYQPAEDGAPVSQPVGNAGPLVTQPLTRPEGVIFTVTASVHVLGQDEPLIAQSQLSVSVEALSLAVEVEPPVVGVGGLVRLRWDAANADHCVLDDGSILPAKGFRYFIVDQGRQFTVTAFAADGSDKQTQLSVEVDPTIQPTEAGYVISGAPGGAGAPGTNSDQWEYTTGGGGGGTGGDGVLQQSLPVLDKAGRARVIPITITGGTGGPGGAGGAYTVEQEVYGYGDSGPGGPGGDAVLDVTLVQPDPVPAQYIISLVPGQGGQGGPAQQPSHLAPEGGIPGQPGAQGGPGRISATIDGEPVTLPGGSAAAATSEE
jgi:hypothetical protein